MKAQIPILLLAVILSVVASVTVSLLMQPQSTPVTEARQAGQLPDQTELPASANDSMLDLTPAKTAPAVSDNTNLARLQQLNNSLEDLASRVFELETVMRDLSTGATGPSNAQGTNTDDVWFNRDAMLSTGLSEAEISLIRERYEALEMEKLYLRDRAIREEWINTQRYNDELDKINDGFSAFRNEINNEVYDALLFATGRSNRVVVQDVIQNSPASVAGIRAGDYIVRYNNMPIYSAIDLRQAITEGNAGEDIAIELLRDGRSTTVYVPRGPLGIRMESRSIQP